MSVKLSIPYDNKGFVSVMMPTEAWLRIKVPDGDKEYGVDIPLISIDDEMLYDHRSIFNLLRHRINHAEAKLHNVMNTFKEEANANL